VCTVCPCCAQRALRVHIVRRTKGVHILTYFLSFVHTLIVFQQIHTFMYTLFSVFTKNSEHVSANCPYCLPLLTIQAARGSPNQAFSSLTVILQGGESGLSAGPVFWVMACTEHRDICASAHMEPAFVLTWNPCSHGT
jgi:hypothetical protein